MKVFSKLEKSKEFWTLLFSSFIFFILRLPSLFEPIWYGDEGIYQVLGMAIRNGKLLYRDAWDNKPPFLYVLYAVFNSDQFWVRLASLIFGLGSLVFFFLLAKTLFKKENNEISKITVFSTILFSVLFSIPLLEGNIANAENFMLLPIVASAYLIFNIKSFSSKKLLLIPLVSGLLLSFAFLFKVVALFDFASFLIFLFLVNLPKKLSIFKIGKVLFLEIKEITFLVIGFVIPIFITFLFFLLNGSLSDLISAAFLQNVSYVGYGNSFIFSQGLLLLKLASLSFFILFLIFKRKKFSNAFLFILIWFSFSLFNAFFSQRPYTHYLLVLLPSLVLLIGLIFYEKKFQKFLIVSFALTILLLSKNFRVYGKTFSYYANFYDFILGTKSLSSYRNFFDSKTDRDYKVSQYIKLHTQKKDSIFLWGDSAQLYAMSNKLPPGRYTVAYHINFYKNSINETKNAIKEAKPKYIIIENSKDPIPFSLASYKEKINIDNILIYEYNF
ncbi:MAG: hypothetical protein M1450_01485 [Patescibacteria group bacterium]|nr:hypothetical protein [Patescibacteria group bacterium]